MFARIRLPDSLGDMDCPLADQIAFQLIRIDAERLRDSYCALRLKSNREAGDNDGHVAAQFFLAHPMLLVAGLVSYRSIEGRPPQSASSLWQWIADASQTDRMRFVDLDEAWRPRGKSPSVFSAGLSVAKALRGFRPWRSRRVAKGRWHRQLSRLLRKGSGWRRRKSRRVLDAALSKRFARELSAANDEILRVDGWWLRAHALEFGSWTAIETVRHGPGDGIAGAEVAGESEQQLLNAKLESLRRLAYGASHELNNPLANIAMRAQTLLRGEACPDRRKKLQTIEQQAMRAHEMISDLMLFAHPPAPKFDRVDLAELAESVAREIEPRAQSQQISIDVIAEGQFAHWSIDVTQFAEALRALIKNSMESIGTRGAIVIELQRDDAEARILVRDSGPGIDEALAPHIFDPFYSGREAGRGLGFGLSKAWCIARLHGGQLKCLDTSAGQATFLMLLPKAQPAALAR